MSMNNQVSSIMAPVAARMQVHINMEGLDIMRRRHISLPVGRQGAEGPGAAADHQNAGQPVAEADRGREEQAPL